MKLSELKNIGPTLEKQLVAVGIDSPEKLYETGTEETFLRLRAYDESSCLHKLTAIEGAVRGIPKKEIPPERKAELKTFFDKLSSEK